MPSPNPPLSQVNWTQGLTLHLVLDVFAGFYLGGPAIEPEPLKEYVQDTLNELEFLMGDETTEYGAKRIALGRAEPYKIRYVEVGNEDNLGGGLPSYGEYRFQAYYDAIKAKYPDMNIIASTIEIPLAGDALGDWHTYTTPDELVKWFNFWDQNTADHKILVGEYAVSSPPTILLPPPSSFSPLVLNVTDRPT